MTLLDVAAWLLAGRPMPLAEWRKWRERRRSFAAGPIGPNRWTEEMRARWRR